MADTLFGGLKIPVLESQPLPPEDGFVRLYALPDGSVYLIRPDGSITKVTDG